MKLKVRYKHYVKETVNWLRVTRYDKSVELYHLGKDKSESVNVAQQNPVITEQLLAEMKNSRNYHPEFTLKKWLNPWNKNK